MPQRKNTPHIGDIATHRHLDLDPRPVVEVSPDGKHVKLQLNTTESSWVAVKNYRFREAPIA